MKLTVLIENTALSDDLFAEHGISLYIETGGRRILFDSGQSGAFADNAGKLKIDLSGVDFAVLSHGHYDHGGGLQRFLRLNSTAKIYMNRNAFGPHYRGTEKYIGIDPALRESDRIVYAGDTLTMAEGLTLYSCRDWPLKFPIDNSGLTVLRDRRYVPESFDHEQYLLIEEEGRRILISGCSHRGILNIMNWFRPDVMVGGFHFKDIPLDDGGKERLREAARELSSYDTDYYTGHCTGVPQYEFLREMMGERLRYIPTGTAAFI